MLTSLHLALALGMTVSRAPCAPMNAAAVFMGRVIQIDTLVQDSTWLPGDTAHRRVHPLPQVIRYTFEVTRTWKGSRKARLSVVSRNVSTSCGREYALQNRYLVYAERERPNSLSADQLMTYSCSRVRPEGDARDDLQVLGPGRPPKSWRRRVAALVPERAGRLWPHQHSSS